MTNAPSTDVATSNRALATSAAAMASGTLVSRILGLVRNALLVAVVGLVAFGETRGSMADAWSVANKLPNIISMLLAGGILNAVLVPQVVRAMKRPDGGQDYVNRLLTLAIVILAALTALLTLAASVLVTVYAVKFDPEWKAVAIALAFWCVPQLFFYGLYTLLGQVLNARSVFGPYMWAPVVNNVVAIAGLIAFLLLFGGIPDGGLPPSAWTADRIMLLAGTATLGVVAQALVLIVPLHRSGFRFRPTWGIRGHGLGTASTVASWAFAALAVGQLGYLAVSNLAAAAGSEAEVGGPPVAGNFAYDNAFLIFMLPQSLITVSLVTALFTRVAHNAAARNGAKVRDDLSLGMRTLGIVTVFATAAFSVLAIPLVQVVVLDGADFASYRAVGAVLVAMSFGLVAIAIWTMVQRVFYAYEDTRTLFRIQAPMAGILLVGCGLSWWLLEPQWWVVGAGISTTVSNTVGATVGYLATRKYLPNLDGPRVLRTHLRVVLAAIPTALVGWGVLHLWGVETSLAGAFLRVVVIGTLMLVGYVTMLRLLHVSELDGIADRVSGPLARVASKLQVTSKLRGDARAPRTMAGSTGGSEGGVAQVSAGSSTTLRAGETVATRYRLERELNGESTVSGTWAATDTVLDQPVRVLLIEGALRESTIDAARRAALIEDPRLSQVLRAGSEGSQGYVVTDAPDGATLADLVRESPLSASQARALIGEAASALDVARRRGVHHLALHPANLVRTSAGEVLVTGLGTEAALRTTEILDAAAAARRDAVSLVQLLYTALTGTWPGDAADADGLPEAPRLGGGVVPAGDVVARVPNDLDTLCAVTLGAHDDGPTTAGALVADLAPWGQIDVDDRALPPVVAPTGSAADAGSSESTESAEASDPGPVAETEGTQGPGTDTATFAAPSFGPGVPVGASEWMPQPLPGVAGLAPFSDLGTDTGTIPAVAAPSEETHVSAPIETSAAGGDADATPGSSWSDFDADPGVDAATGRLPMLARTPLGWDRPGGAEPQWFGTDAPRSEAGLAPGAGVDSRAETGEASSGSATVVGSAATVAATAVASATSGIRVTNRRINEVSDRVGGEARRLFDDAGQRLGTITGRAGAFVEDVRDEFRPVDEPAPDGRSRFNPAPIALLVMIAVVIFALVMAVLTLRDASTEFTPGPNPGEIPPSATATEAPTEAEPTPTPSATTPEGIPAANGVPITLGTTFDPTVSGGENQSDAYLAFDGTAETTWNSLRYNSPTYGMKAGLGFTIQLEETALISSVTLDVAGAGGLVEIRIGNAAAPNVGDVLASGAMGQAVTYTFEEPIEADSISLWFPELPVASSDGRNRIELAEITLG